MKQNDNLKPNEKEILFLSLSYNKFYDIFEEIFLDDFWLQSKEYRFYKIMQGFLIYSELLNYEPIQWILKELEIKRPPMEAKIARELFKFIRNFLVHFPLFSSWNEVWLNKSLLTWSKNGGRIFNFLNTYQQYGEIKYRFWESTKQKMTYITINLSFKFGEKSKIFLKDIISEKEGVKFSYILMKKILDTQVYEIKATK